MEEWIEEFMFRGRPPSGPDSDKMPEFHVILGKQVDNPFDASTKQRQLFGPMTPSQAEALGWPLSRLVEGINATMYESALAAISDTQNILQSQKDRIAVLEAELAKYENG